MLGDLFAAPVQNMNFVSYMQYVNTNGKVTARSLMDINTILLSKVEEQEKLIEQHEQNFKDIEEVLAKLVDKKVSKTEAVTKEPAKDVLVYECQVCKKQVTTPLALSGHMRSHKKATAQV